MKQNNNRPAGKIKKTTGKYRFGKRGFTLVEIMVVVAIIGIIALFAGPLLIDFGPNLRVKAAARDLHTNLQRMKVEAIKRNKEVTISFTSVGCPPTGPTSPRGKYTITIDGISKDYALEQDTAICPLDSLDPSLSPPLPAYYKFTPQGLWLDSADVAGGAKFQIQNDRGRRYRVSVSLAGGISTTKL